MSILKKALPRALQWSSRVPGGFLSRDLGARNPSPEKCGARRLQRLSTFRSSER